MLLATMIAIVVLSTLAAFALQNSSTGYRNSMRQNLLEQTKLTAESEMEYLFYKWKYATIHDHIAPDTMQSTLTTAGVTVDPTTIATASGSPFLAAQTGAVAVRSIQFLPPTAIGILPGTNKVNKVSLFKALVRVETPNISTATTVYHLGRRFAYSSSSLYQYSVFYQGDMEFSAGSSMQIEGDLSSNGSVYIGAQPSLSLTIVNTLRYGALFNGATDPLTGTQHKKTGTDTLIDPIFDSNPADGVTPPQPAARASQVSALSDPENFVGGVNVASVLAQYPSAYSNSNDVYRSVIAPPPVNSFNVPIPEDPTISAGRMYNQAGLRITIGATTPNSVSIIYPGDPLTDYSTSTSFTGVITQVRSPVYDQREGRNIQITEIDVNKLNNAIAAVATLNSAYTGVVYLIDVNNGGSDGAFRLINGTSTPNYNNKGFTVATDNGLYIKGDYNTANLVTGTNVSNRAALMADAITLLSDAWSDTNANQPLALRVANSNAVIATKPTDGSTTAQDAYTTIVAAIVSGNTPSASSTSTGGVQNLVRLLEDWWALAPAQNTLFKGSTGQLFTSVHFTGVYKNSGVANNIYLQPHQRYLTFDQNLATNPPGGTPTVTTFSRGDYFNW